MEKYEKETLHRAEQSWPKTFSEYLSLKEQFKLRAKEAEKDFLIRANDDIKRMQIHELLAVYNHEEAARGNLSPTQALRALWDICHKKEYQKVVSEFDKLCEQVDRRYGELMEKRIKAPWSL